MTVSNLLYGVKDAGNIAFWGASTGELGLDIDYANKFDLSLKEEGIEYAKKKGKNAIKFDGEVTGELKISVDLLNADLMAFLNRSPLLKTATDIFKSEKIVVTSADQVVTLEEVPVGLLGVYKVTSEGSKISKLTTATLLADDVTLTGAIVGDIIKIYYTTSKEAIHFGVTGTKAISEDYIVYADVIGKKYEGGEKLPFQYKIYKVAPQATISLSYDATKVSGFEATFDVLCDANDKIVDYTEIPLV